MQEESAYHPPVLKKVASPGEKVLQAVLVAVVGTGLGIGVGVFLAGRTVSSGASTAAASTPATGATSATAAVTNQAKTTGEVKKQDISVADAASVGRQSAASEIHPPVLVRASLNGIRTGLRRRHRQRHRAALAAVARHKEKPVPPVVDEAKLEIPDGRFRFTIEGDQTATAYDSQSGVVSTDGSGMFVVENTPGEAAMGHSQESPANVHYKCDQDANCSLIMASMIVPHARMRTVNNTTDLAYAPVLSGSQAPAYFGHVSR
jgi:hypothetical protein